MDSYEKMMIQATDEEEVNATANEDENFYLIANVIFKMFQIINFTRLSFLSFLDGGVCPFQF
jgi:hypothetical protein